MTSEIVGAPFRHTVVPGINTVMYLKTTPRSTCFLRPDGDNESSHCLKYFSDEEGFIFVYVRPSIESKDTTKFVIDCESEGSITRYPLHLRASRSESSEMPFPSRQRPLRKRHAAIRPGLTTEEALRLPREELLARGYPPRPNSKSAPLRTWLKAVSVPAINVGSQPIVNVGATHLRDSTRSSKNWSGFVLTGFDLFDEVFGEWMIPWVRSGESGGTVFSPNITASSMWIGIDGYTSGDLIQARTEQQSMTFSGYSLFNYYAWTQVLPAEQNEAVQSNLHVSPNDQMLVTSVLDLNTSTGQLFLQNNTTNEFIYVQVPVGAFAPGNSTEWIMERPTFNGSLTDLSNYGLAVMSSAFAAGATPSGIISYNTTVIDGNILAPNSTQLTMFNGAHDALSLVTPLDELSMLFSWLGYH
jgi:hypothetical protein